MFRQRTKKGSDMSRMDKKEKKQMEMEQQAREEALEEELEAELPVQEAQPQEAQPAAPTQEELDAAKAQAEEYLTLAQRVQADFDNFRRRNESVRADAYNEGIRSLAAVLLHTDPALTWWAFPIAEGVCLILALLLFRSAYRKRIAPLGA